jgi:hypothetical protein
VEEGKSAAEESDGLLDKVEESDDVSRRDIRGDNDEVLEGDEA